MKQNASQWQDRKKRATGKETMPKRQGFRIGLLENKQEKLQVNKKFCDRSPAKINSLRKSNIKYIRHKFS
jgi:hypothetical protein